MSAPTAAAMAELRERIGLAADMVSALCQPRGTEGSRDWTMSIPAEPDRDPDLVIAAGLDAGRTALDALDTAYARAAERCEWTPAIAEDPSTPVLIAGDSDDGRALPVELTVGDLQAAARTLDAAEAPGTGGTDG